ncbi:uncharacterized protein LOC133906382 [Phragmites australis]|uniref:uncharacterized protein LOC133906382 n=1 Tax=Phragmites australis TaxID=29695 RepID=UPI002D7A24DB|nr:uncharacterized protein LOC133906382 [Phragmites australis]
MGGGVRPTTSWRPVVAAALAVCALPVVLTLAALCLPLLCCAVAAVRFRRVRRRRMRGCCGATGGWRAETIDAGDRLRLLHKYLEDQMELVAADDAGELLDPAKPWREKK